MKNNKGFTLVELLVTIAIVSIILGIVGTLVIGSISKSKERSQMIAYNNIKSSANTYVKEFSDDVVWKNDVSSGDKYSCVSVQSLIDKGYFKKEEMNDYSSKFVKVVADEYNNIVYEKIAEESDACSEFYTKAKVPTSKELCNNLKYSGSEQSLLNLNSISEIYGTQEVFSFSLDGENFSGNSLNGKSAGSYKVYFKLIDGYAWSDGTRDIKEITCSIKKATPIIKVYDQEGNGFIDKPKIGKEEIFLKSPVDGKVYVKSSNSKYVSVDEISNNNVNSDVEKKIGINILATRKNVTTYLTVTVVPNDDKNYHTGSYRFSVGEIDSVKVKIPKGSPLEPTDDINEEQIVPDDQNYCSNPFYNGNQLFITKEPGSLDGKNEDNAGYTFYNNEHTEIGTYEVIAKLKYGYVWDDGTTEDQKIICSIREPIVKVNYKDYDGNDKKINDVVGCSPKDAWYLKTYGEYGGNLCTTATKTGYTFSKWYKDYKEMSEVNLVENSSLVEKNYDHSIYAKWTPNTYYVKYNGNGATSGSMSNSTHTYDTAKALTSNGFSKTGYTFGSWNTNSGGTGTFYSNAASVKNLTSKSGGTVNLYVQWNPITYSIKYNGNGATSGSMSNSTHTYDTAKALTSNGFSKTGYKFNGWNTKADGTGTSYSNTVSVKNLTSKSGGTINLYAQWKKDITLTLVYYNNNATATTHTIKKTVYNGTTSASFTIPSDIASKTYSNSSECGSWDNLGWSTSDAATASVGYVKNATLTLSSSKTLYARYQRIAKFIYDFNGGTSVSSRAETMNRNASGNSSNLGPWTETIKRHHITRSGWQLDSWCFDNNGIDDNGDGSLECDNRVYRTVSGTLYPEEQKKESFTCSGKHLFATWKK